MSLMTISKHSKFCNCTSPQGSINLQGNADIHSNGLGDCYFSDKCTTSRSEKQKSRKCKTKAHDDSLKANSTFQKDLQSIFHLLDQQDALKMVVELDSLRSTKSSYLAIVSRMGIRGEESCLLGVSCRDTPRITLALKILVNTKISLDGDGGFSINAKEHRYSFKPISVHAMWSCLQMLYQVCAKAHEQNYFEGGPTHVWVNHYITLAETNSTKPNKWQVKHPCLPKQMKTSVEQNEMKRLIRMALREIMRTVDLEEVTCLMIRNKLEEQLGTNLSKYKSFIDEEMLVILGQADGPTEIFEHVYLGSEWNASNFEELQNNGVGHILNTAREIDNFFPGSFEYLNVRINDDEDTDFLKYWSDTFKYITKAKDRGSKVLIHCKMGVSRSASVVIAYAMKAYNWDFKTAFKHVKTRRNCIRPNTSFLTQLEMYEGILNAMKNKEKLQKLMSGKAYAKNLEKNRRKMEIQKIEV